MDKTIKNLRLYGVSIPMDGWVLWQGSVEKVENLFRQILRLDPCDSLTINAEKISSQRFSIGVRMAAIFEWGGLLSNRTLIENLLLPFDYHSKNTETIEERVFNIYKMLGYEQHLSSRPFYVPRNVQKLTMILRALLQEPDCIFAINLSFGLEERDKIFLSAFMQDYRHINIHFSEGNVYDKDEFTEVIDTNLWEKSS